MSVERPAGASIGGARPLQVPAEPPPPEPHTPGVGRTVSEPDDASLGELFSRMTNDVSTLVSKEVALAKVEIREEVVKAGKGAGMLGAGGVVALLALLLLSFAGAWGLAVVIPAGFAFLAMGVLYLVVAVGLLLVGRKELKSVHPKTEQTVETLKEDVQWAKQQKS